MNYIINSLLDSDLYKLTMGQAAFHQHSDLKVKYRFRCRNKGVRFSKAMVAEIINQVRHFCELTFTNEEIKYLGTMRFMSYSYLEFLRLYRPLFEHFSIELNSDGTITVTVEGPWYQTIYWEVPLLSIINEVYFSYKYTLDQQIEIDNFCESRLLDKIQSLHNNKYVLGVITDFGTRRRRSFDWMDKVIKTFVESDLGKTKFVGTSNVYFAMKYGIKAVGTNAHEWYMAAQGMKNVPLAHTNAYMLGSWIDEYHGDLGFALTDCLGTDHFLKDFDLFHSKLWDGVRNDSGDPFEWGDKMISHYEKMRIDPKTKTLLFSNSLDFELSDKLKKYFDGRINISFGIGTFLTGVQKFMSSWGEEVVPLNIVIKMVECNGMPVAKLSDDVGKGMCEDDSYVRYLQETISRAS